MFGRGGVRTPLLKPEAIVVSGINVENQFCDSEVDPTA